MQTADAPRPSGATVFIVIASVAFGLLAMTLCLASMANWGTAFDASPAAVQSTYSVYLIAFAAGQLFYGPLSDRYGRRYVLIAGLGICVAASVAAAFAQDIEHLIAARAIQGAGACAGMVLGRALVQDLYEGAARTRMLGYTGVALGATPSVGLVAGGYLDAFAGWETTFFATAAVGLLLVAVVAVGLPHLPRAERPESGFLSVFYGAGRLLRIPRFILLILVTTGNSAAFFSYLSGAPTVIAGLGISTENVGWYAAACSMAYIVGNFCTARLITRIGDYRTLAIGQALAFLAPVLSLSAAFGGSANALFFVLPMALMGFGHGMLMPAALTGVIGTRPQDAGAASAISGSLQLAGGALAGFILGLFAEIAQLNTSTVILVSMIPAVLALILLRPLWHEQEQTAS